MERRWKKVIKSYRGGKEQTDASTDGLEDALTVPRSLGRGTPLIFKQPQE